MIADITVAIHKGIGGSAEGKVTVVEHHEDRLFFFRLLRADADV